MSKFVRHSRALNAGQQLDLLSMFMRKALWSVTPRLQLSLDSTHPTASVLSRQLYSTDRRAVNELAGAIIPVG